MDMQKMIDVLVDDVVTSDELTESQRNRTVDKIMNLSDKELIALYEDFTGEYVTTVNS